MFQKATKRLPAGGNGGTSVGVPSIISGEMTLKGDLVSTGEVHIDGVIRGDVTVKGLTVGENAQVHGHISADWVRICGAVTGRIQAPEVTLTRTARVVGDIDHLTLTIDAGAYLEGHCQRLAKEESVRKTNGANGSAKPPERTVESPMLVPMGGGGVQ
jgi:cytoskeletal protein CcmA (bactofilin family)